MKVNVKKIFRTVVCPILFLGAGFIAGFGMENKFNDARASTAEKGGATLRDSSNTFKMVNPLLECDSIESVSNGTINRIRDSLTTIIRKKKANADLSHVSVYFRDLNNGPWMGIDEKEMFTPGSLLKVPYLLAYYKKAEQDPKFLSHTLEFTGTPFNIEMHYASPEKLEMGKRYSIEELIRRMIVNSDNDSTWLLSQSLSERTLKDSFSNLGIEPPKENDYLLSVRTYASFFRILFNATYLEASSSEKALTLLSQTTFTKGIRSGVPSTFVVADKYGERFNVDGENQLHDCGIIYYPGRPYLLCVMTRGRDFDDQAKFISDISRAVYLEINEDVMNNN